jgi:formate dehydrogenase major subunit
VSTLIGRIGSWPVLRQLRRGDPCAVGDTAATDRTRGLRARIHDAGKPVRSICPYCAVGCGQKVYVKDGKITDIEGDEDSPISRGRLCPKGAASFQLVTGDHRVQQVLHRRPGGTRWEVLDLEDAMERVATRVWETRNETWEETAPNGQTVKRTLGIAHLGGATLDNEENYLLKKLFTALGVLQVENQARI